MLIIRVSLDFIGYGIVFNKFVFFLDVSRILGVLGYFFDLMVIFYMVIDRNLIRFSLSNKK